MHSLQRAAASVQPCQRALRALAGSQTPAPCGCEPGGLLDTACPWSPHTFPTPSPRLLLPMQAGRCTQGAAEGGLYRALWAGARRRRRGGPWPQRRRRSRAGRLPPRRARRRRRHGGRPGPVCRRWRGLGRRSSGAAASCRCRRATAADAALRRGRAAARQSQPGQPRSGGRGSSGGGRAPAHRVLRAAK